MHARPQVHVLAEHDVRIGVGRCRIAGGGSSSSQPALIGRRSRDLVPGSSKRLSKSIGPSMVSSEIEKSSGEASPIQPFQEDLAELGSSRERCRAILERARQAELRRERDDAARSHDSIHLHHALVDAVEVAEVLDRP